MKNNFTVIRIFLFAITLIVSCEVMAHFGTRGPYGGGSVTCATSSATAVYLGTSEGGVFESTTTALVAWRARPVGLKSGKITALTHSGSYLVAGTADSGVFIFNGSLGNDRYWNKINNGLPNLKIKSLASIDTITFLVGTDGGGIYKTTNKGVTWNLVNSASLNNQVITAIVKAGTRVILATESNGLFYSDDKGDAWTSFNDVNTLSIDGTRALSYNSSTDELIVLNENGLFIAGTASTTLTPSFLAAQTGLPSCSVRTISNNGVGWYLATDIGVYTTASSSINWTAANIGLSGNELNVTAVIPFQTSIVAGTLDDGVFKASISAPGWVKNNTNFNNLSIYSVACKDSFLVATATEKGIFVSKDIAANFNRSNNGITDSLNVTDLIWSGTYLFAATKNAGIFVSTDTGKVWNAYNFGLSSLHITKIAVSAKHLYAITANGTIYQSGGIGWTSIQTGLPAGVEPTSLAFHNGVIFVGTLGDGVFSRNETSGTWAAVNNGLSNLYITSIVTNGQKLFVGTDGAGVFSSNFSTINWSSTAPLSIAHTTMMGLTGTHIQAMAYFKGYIYASYKGGVLASSDNGLTWIGAGNQFNLPSYTDVKKISFVATRAFVTTEYNSLYSQSLTELPTVPDIVTGLEKEQFLMISSGIVLSPNPGNGHFNIQLSSVQPSDISEINIIDSFGKVVGHFESFQSEFSLDYPQGMYYIQLKTLGSSITKKLIIE